MGFRGQTKVILDVNNDRGKILYRMRSKGLSVQNISDKLKTKTKTQVYSYYNKNRSKLDHENGFLADGVGNDNYQIMEHFLTDVHSAAHHDPKPKRYIEFKDKSADQEVQISSELLNLFIAFSNKDKNDNITLKINTRLLQFVLMKTHLENFYKSVVNKANNESDEKNLSDDLMDIVIGKDHDQVDKSWKNNESLIKKAIIINAQEKQEYCQDLDQNCFNLQTLANSQEFQQFNLDSEKAEIICEDSCNHLFDINIQLSRSLEGSNFDFIHDNVEHSMN